MAESPDINTARLRLTPFSERHIADYYVAWLNNTMLMRYSEQRHKSHTIESCRDYWQSFKNTPNYFWAIEALTTEFGHVGNLNAYVDMENQVVDLGILIAPDAQGRGYGIEAWVGAMEFFLVQNDLRKLTAGMMATNLGMIRITQQTGMVEDGTRKKQCLCEGREVDVIYFAIFRHTVEAIAKEHHWMKFLGRNLTSRFNIHNSTPQEKEKPSINNPSTKS